MNGLRSTIRQDMRDIHFLSVMLVVLDKRGQCKGILCGQYGICRITGLILQRQHEVKMNHKREDSAVTLDTSGIEIEQHDGLWHTADVREIKDEIFYLMKTMNMVIRLRLSLSMQTANWWRRNWRMVLIRVQWKQFRSILRKKG